MADLLDSHTILLVGHVAGAILLLGPLTAAASRFPAIATADEPTMRNLSVATELHRTTRAYGSAAAVVPVLGLALAGHHGMFAARWIQLSVVLVVVGAILLFALVLPGQAKLLGHLRQAEAAVERTDVTRLRVATGLFALSWILVVVLMVGKPT